MGEVRRLLFPVLSAFPWYPPLSRFFLRWESSDCWWFPPPPFLQALRKERVLLLRGCPPLHLLQSVHEERMFLLGGCPPLPFL